MALLIAAIALVTLLLIWLAVGHWLAGRLLYPPRQPLLHTPAEYGLPFEEVVFPSKDHRRLKGWWIPAADSTRPAAHVPVVILLHSLFGNRHGLARHYQHWPFLIDSDIDLLQNAKSFHQAGFAVLLFDFRNHGESQRGLCAGGLTEDQDVMGAVDYIFTRLMDGESGGKPPVGVVGYGLGAAAALAAIGREKGGTEVIRVFSGDSAGSSGFITISPLNVKYLRFVVAIQPTSLATYLRGHLYQRTNLLAWLLLPLVDHICQGRGGYPLGVKALLKSAREVHLPVLFVRSAAGTPAEATEALAFYDALPGPKELCEVDEACTPLDLYRHIVEHPETMMAFVTRQIDSNS